MTALNEIPSELQARVPDAIEAAERAFWAVIAARFPEVTSGDVGPDWIAEREIFNHRSVASWIAGNLPADYEVIGSVPVTRREAEVICADGWLPTSLEEKIEALRNA